MSKSSDLKTRAEEALRHLPASPDKAISEDLSKLVHELNVYHVELELQNEELRQAQAALEAERDRYSDLYDFSPVGYITVSSKGHILEANLTAAGMLGRERGSLIKRRFTEFVSADDQDIFYQHRKLCLESGTRRHCELRMTAGQGSGFTAGLESIAVAGKEKVPARLRISISDITGRKLTEDRLRQAEKMEAVGQLAGGVAHDFNNQLAIIMNFTELIKKRIAGDNELNGYADTIMQSAEHSAHLTGQLLAYSRKGKYQVISLDIHKIISEIISLLSRSFDKNIVFRQDLKADPSFTLCDYSQMQNVLLNIALNARDAMPNGGELHFSTENVTLSQKEIMETRFDIEPGRYIRLCIRDSGGGMEEGIKSRIFEPFFTTKPPGKGTGMGLSAAFGTLQHHGGAISVESTAGKGTRFFLYLPAVPDQAVRAPGKKKSRRRPPEKKAAPAAPQLSRILFVDDEENMCVSASIILSLEGFAVSTSSDSRKAVALYQKIWKEVDLVILDMIMPKMNGKEAFLEMKKINPGIKALMVSGYSTEEEIAEALAMGIKGFLGKPYTQEGLMGKIAEVVQS